MKHVITRVIDGNGTGSYFVEFKTGAPMFSDLEFARRFETRDEAESFFPPEAIDALGLSVEKVEA